MNWTACILIALMSVGWAEGQSPECLNGILYYQNHTIELPGRCDQIWTAPGGSIIAFAMNTSGGSPPATKVYWASKADGFKPVNVPLKMIRLYGIHFDSYEFPSLSPDGKLLFFQVPTSATSSTLFSTSLSGGGTRLITEVGDYCVIWDGKLAGSILYSRRGYAPNSYVIRYSCYLRSPGGATSLVSQDCNTPFGTFQRAWEQANQSRCPSYYGP